MTGNVFVYSSSRLDGWELNLLRNISRRDNLSFSLIGGFRMLNLDEDLRITETIQNLSAGFGGTSFLGALVDPPGSVTTFDNFVAHNWFYGGQIGARADWQRGKLSVGVVAKVALGLTQELVTIEGASTLLNNGVPVQTVPGGVLALPSNIGRYLHNEFAVVPEFGLNIAYQITPAIRARFGYTFLYWSDVARPGAQVDTTLNPGSVPTDASFGTPGPNQPTFAFHQSSFWAQGLNFGLEFRY